MPIRSQAARDLEWVIKSAPLLASELPEELSPEWGDAFFALRKLDENDLHDFLSTRESRRVGRYFENLVEYWLKRILRVRMLVSQQQYFRDGQTIGELDFVYEDVNGVVTHLETAVKFYLHYSQSGRSCPQLRNENNNGSHLIGPNASDNFEKKTARLFDHQLPLGKELFTNVQRQFAFVKGRIFHHITDAAEISKPPCLLANNCLRGTWLRHSEIDQWLNGLSDNMKFRLQPKPFWLADDIVSIDNESSLSRSRFIEFVSDHFENASHPLLFSILKKCNDARVESNRGFIVSEQWPQT